MHLISDRSTLWCGGVRATLTIWMLANLLVHEWLGEHGFIDFVVAVAAIADQIDDNVLVECGTPFGGNIAHVHDGLRIVGVHVENGCLRLQSKRIPIKHSLFVI